MVMYTCRCGYHMLWGSMSPARCKSCEKCGSGFSWSPNIRVEPEPHHYNSDGVCVFCLAKMPAMEVEDGTPY